jgi:hypothetical protein
MSRIQTSYTYAVLAFAKWRLVGPGLLLASATGAGNATASSWCNVSWRAAPILIDDAIDLALRIHPSTWRPSDSTLTLWAGLFGASDELNARLALRFDPPQILALSTDD